mmetsp:Transcript_27266/g.89038  ORF Transcript_27266/g.89038 Transcript_27266/m.89038 type:complete len:324 (-) Transcript_27266:104-1075(-)
MSLDAGLDDVGSVAIGQGAHSLHDGLEGMLPLLFWVVIRKLRTIGSDLRSIPARIRTNFRLKLVRVLYVAPSYDTVTMLRHALAQTCVLLAEGGELLVDHGELAEHGAVRVAALSKRHVAVHERVLPNAEAIAEGADPQVDMMRVGLEARERQLDDRALHPLQPPLRFLLMPSPRNRQRRDADAHHVPEQIEGRLVGPLVNLPPAVCRLLTSLYAVARRQDGGVGGGRPRASSARSLHAHVKALGGCADLADSHGVLLSLHRHSHRHLHRRRDGHLLLCSIHRLHAAVDRVGVIVPVLHVAHVLPSACRAEPKTGEFFDVPEV